jgi:mRNA interferase RelE/StbE
MPYKLKLLTELERQLRKLPNPDRERVAKAMRSLAIEPRQAGTLHLIENLHRIRVGNYRIVYAVFDADVVVLVCKVARRTEATYRDIRALLQRAKDILGAA